MEESRDYYGQLYDLYMNLRHINDEYKAYAPKPYREFMQTMWDAFRLLYRVNLETGDTTVPPGYTDDDYRITIEKLEKEAEKMVPLHDPESDKIFIWEQDNIPWDLMEQDEWLKFSYDAADFSPHMVPFLQEDGEKHPAVIIIAGSTRLNIPEGYPVAEFYQKNGFQAFVLNSRVASGQKARKSMNRAMDLQRAIRYIRFHAENLQVDENHIIIHCCSLGNRPAIDMINTLGIRTSPSRRDPKYYPDPVDRISAAVQGYVSMYPASFLKDIENPCFRDFPPVFGIAGNADGSLWRMMPFFYSLTMGNVPVELHVYDGVGHGFALANEEYALQGERSVENSIDEWTHLLLLWLKRRIKD